MLNRRSFISALAALPIVGPLFKADEPIKFRGVPLKHVLVLGGEDAWTTLLSGRTTYDYVVTDLSGKSYPIKSLSDGVATVTGRDNAPLTYRIERTPKSVDRS